MPLKKSQRLRKAPKFRGKVPKLATMHLILNELRHTEARLRENLEDETYLLIKILEINNRLLFILKQFPVL